MDGENLAEAPIPAGLVRHLKRAFAGDATCIIASKRLEIMATLLKGCWYVESFIFCATDIFFLLPQA